MEATITGIAVVLTALALILVIRRKRASPMFSAAGKAQKIPRRGSGELSGQPYSWQQSGAGQNKNPSFVLTVPCRLEARFSLHRQGAFDRLGRRLGLVEKITSHDDNFDDSFYIYSPHPEFCSLLFSRSSVRAATRRLLDRGFVRLQLNGKGLVLSWAPYRPKNRQISAAEIPLLVADLVEILKDSERLTLSDGDRQRQRSWKHRLTALYSLSGLALLLGLTAMPWGLSVYTPLDTGRVFLFALQYSLPACALFLTLAFATLRGNSAAHGHFLGLTLLALAGFVILGLGTVSLLNGRLDTSEPVAHTALVVDKYYTKNKNDYTYYLSLQSWRPGHDTEKQAVNRRLYDRIEVGESRMEMVTRRGRFHFEWLVSCRPLQP